MGYGDPSSFSSDGRAFARGSCGLFLGEPLRSAVALETLVVTPHFAGRHLGRATAPPGSSWTEGGDPRTASALSGGGLCSGPANCLVREKQMPHAVVLECGVTPFRGWVGRVSAILSCSHWKTHTTANGARLLCREVLFYAVLLHCRRGLPTSTPEQSEHEHEEGTSYVPQGGLVFV